MSLLCFASRPLSVDEVIEATAIDVYGLERYDSQRRFTDADDLLRVCPGLIEISSGSADNDNNNESSGHFEYFADDNEDATEWEKNKQKAQSDQNGKQDLADDGSQCSERTRDERAIRIAHFSVQEFLTSERIRSSTAAAFAMSSPTQHFRLCKSCLLYLHNDDYVGQRLTRRLAHEYSWVRYASKHWIEHYRQADQEAAKQLSQLVIKLFTKGPSLNHWLGMWDPEYEIEREASSVSGTHPSPIFYAALLGLDNILVGLLADWAGDINAVGDRFGTALIAASLKGYTTTVRLLLDEGADVNMQAGQEGTALIAASFKGQTSTVELLLDRGAEINLHAHGDCNSALVAASSPGKLKPIETIELLLDRGANIDMQCAVRGTALIRACGGNNAKKVELLLSRGANVHIRGGRWDTALAASCAAYGSTKIVQLLLDHGADINARGRVGTALDQARRFLRPDIEKLLLAHGARGSEDLD